MANLTAAANPELVLEMEAMERTTPAHCDEWNRRHQQLLDNDGYLKRKKADGEGIAFSVTENAILRVTYDDGEQGEEI